MTMRKDSPISATYTGNGLATTFPVPFMFLEASHVVVSVGGVPRTSGFALEGAGLPDGGSVRFDAAPDVGVAVGVALSVPVEQPVSLRQQGTFRPETLENALDRATMILRRLEAAIGDALVFVGGAIDAKGARVVNVGAPAQATDAATLGDVQAAILAALAGGGAVAPRVWSFAGDGLATAFPLAGATLAAPESYVVTVGGVEQDPTTDYAIDLAGARIVFDAATPAAARVSVRCWTYALPQYAPTVYAEAAVPAASAARLGQVVVVVPPVGPTELRACLLAEDGTYGWSLVASGGLILN